MALLAGSPAINAGDNTGAPAHDQRGAGFPRVFGGTIDIGAFELQTPSVPTVAISNVSITEGHSGITLAQFTVSLSGPNVNPVTVAYSTAKSGLLGFTRSTAIAYVKQGIRCNLVVVGTMHTPLVEERLVKQLGAQDAAGLIAKRHAAVPIGRMGDAWDVANAVLFLASDEARYITATQLVVDGGLTAARPG